MTEISKNSGRSELQLAAECVKAAIDDAGLKPTDIDGMTGFTLDHVDEIEVARTVGIPELKLLSRMPHGGGAPMSLVHQAAMAVATGMCKAVVGYRAMNGRSGARYSSGVAEGPETTDRISWGWYMPYGLLTPACWVAMHLQRYLHEYGATDEGLAEIAVTQRTFACQQSHRALLRPPYHAGGLLQRALDRGTPPDLRLLYRNRRRRRLRAHQHGARKGPAASARGRFAARRRERPSTRRS